MIGSIESLREEAKAHGMRRLAVACAQEDHVLLAVEKTRCLGIAEAVLVGKETQIRRIAVENGIDPITSRIIDEPDNAIACRTAVSLVRNGEADAVMKGIVDTSIILKAVLDREVGLRDSKLLSHVALFEIPGFERLLFLTDSAMNIAPDLDAKKDIIRNAVSVANAVGNENPVVACLCAIEKVNPKMPATIDAAALVEAARNGELTNCTVIGPVALDNAISIEAARLKGVADPNAGRADVLLVPNIETGNVFYKTLVFLAHASIAGIVVGAKAPVIVTSRADSEQTKINSIALALALAAKKGEARERTQ